MVVITHEGLTMLLGTEKTCDYTILTYVLTYIHNNGAHNDNTITPIFMGLNKTTQTPRTPQDEGGASKDKV
jgi:hypothetical protein